MLLPCVVFCQKSCSHYLQLNGTGIFLLSDPSRVPDGFHRQLQTDPLFVAAWLWNPQSWNHTVQKQTLLPNSCIWSHLPASGSCTSKPFLSIHLNKCCHCNNLYSFLWQIVPYKQHSLWDELAPWVSNLSSLILNPHPSLPWEKEWDPLPYVCLSWVCIPL